MLVASMVIYHTVSESWYLFIYVAWQFKIMIIISVCYEVIM